MGAKGIDTSYNPVQFGNNNTMGVSDALKNVQSNKKDTPSTTGLAKLYENYFGNTNNTSSNNNNNSKIDANTGNSFLNGLANLGQFLGLGRNVADKVPTINEYLTYDHDTDLSNLQMRYQQALADGASTKDWNWNDIKSNYENLYWKDIQNTINSIPNNTVVEPYDYSWTPTGGY